MKYPIFFIAIACWLSVFLGCKSNQSLQFTKTPKEIGELVTTDLLSRPEFMMYNTEDVKAVHYAEVCAAYGAIKFAALQKDDALIQKLATRYDRVVTENILNTSNHVDANVYGILPLELYLHNKQENYLKQGMEFADGQWENPLPDGLTPQTDIGLTIFT